MSPLVSGNYAHLSSAFEKFQSKGTLALHLHSHLERWVVVWRSKCSICRTPHLDEQREWGEGDLSCIG